MSDPDDSLEIELHAAGHSRVAGMDEVGRGSWAGPLVIAAVIPGPGTPPAGIRDSKLLKPEQRAELEVDIKDWAADFAIGSATAQEIDQLGMASALTTAAHRALAGLTLRPDAVILDGPHDYIGARWKVTARAKADLTSRVVAAASILAKEHHDRTMRDLAAQHPQYRLDVNVGYPSPAHKAALAEHGPVPGLHRLSWKFVDSLPGYQHMRIHPGGQLSLL